ERGNRQRGNDQRDGLVCLPGDVACQRCQPQNQTEIQRAQQSGQRAIDERPVNDGIDVPEMIAQNRYPYRDGNGDKKQDAKEVIQQLVRRVWLIEFWDQIANSKKKNFDENTHQSAEYQPLGLLALEWCIQPSIAVDLHHERPAEN